MGIPAMLERSKPLFVDTTWASNTTDTSEGSLLEIAKTVGCGIVDAPDPLFEQTRICTFAWTGQEVRSHQHLARALVEGWTSDAQHLRQIVMQITKCSQAATTH